MGIRKTMSYLIYGVNILVAIGLLFSYLTSYVSPESTVIFAFFGLGYPILLILNLIFVIYWGIRKKRKVFLSIIILLLGCSHFFQFFQFPFNGEELIEGNSIKVMSYNVRLFDLYDWTKKDKVKEKILNLVNEQSPDVVCFQEYYMKGSPVVLSKTLNMPYVHEYFSKTSIKQGKKAGVGTAIYSKYKIINKGEVLFENEKSNHCTYIDILKEEDTIRIYNAHLGSIRFDYDDYTFIAREKTQSIEEDMMPLKKIARRLKLGFEKRVGQVNQLLEHIQASPYATIIGSDMNDTPISYSYEQFSSVLIDSFNEKGNWTGSTYIGAIPLLRIDYLWHNTKMINTSFETIEKEYSDHRPIIGTYSIVE